MESIRDLLFLITSPALGTHGMKWLCPPNSYCVPRYSKKRISKFPSSEREVEMAAGGKGGGRSGRGSYIRDISNANESMLIPTQPR